MNDDDEDVLADCGHEVHELDVYTCGCGPTFCLDCRDSHVEHCPEATQ